MYKETGRIKALTPIEVRTGRNGKEYRNRKIVLEIEENRGLVRTLALDVDNFRMEVVNEHRVGDKVEVYFNVWSREYNGKWYSSVDLLSIHKVQGADDYAPAAPAPAEDEDLPDFLK